MKPSHEIQHPFRRPIAKVVAAFALAVGLSIGAPLAAQATPYWIAVHSSCSTSKYVILHFTVTGPWVDIGHGNSIDQASNSPDYWELKTGSRVVNTGMHALYWQKWSSAGDISHWSVTCVSYV